MFISSVSRSYTARYTPIYRHLPFLSCRRSRVADTMTGKTGHLERTAREPREKELLDVKLAEVQQINNRVRLLRLTLRFPIKVLAGQWLDTYIPGTPGAGGFTITSPPSSSSTSKTPCFELAIQKSPENAHAAWLWRPVDEIINQELQVRVGGSFVYPPKSKDIEGAKRVVLVAGGVGVNPLVSMMGEMSDRGEDVDVRVLYGSKLSGGNLREVLFLERMVEMFRDGKIRGSLDVFLTDTAGGTVQMPDWMQGTPVKLHDGRMSAQQVKSAINEGNSQQTLVYICGPPSMTDELAAAVSSPTDGVIEAGRVMTEKWW